MRMLVPPHRFSIWEVGAGRLQIWGELRTYSRRLCFKEQTKNWNDEDRGRRIFVNSRPTWSVELVPGLPGPCIETVFRKTNKNKNPLQPRLCIETVFRKTNKNKIPLKTLNEKWQNVINFLIKEMNVLALIRILQNGFYFINSRI